MRGAIAVPPSVGEAIIGGFHHGDTEGTGSSASSAVKKLALRASVCVGAGRGRGGDFAEQGDEEGGDDEGEHDRPERVGIGQGRCFAVSKLGERLQRGEVAGSGLRGSRRSGRGAGSISSSSRHWPASDVEAIH